ncbi:MAG TPA: cell division protein ZapA [Gammaproteobacteria bacterium]|nr:cell division protein ZapA [Gammaproteobacteria bacterium]
MNDSLVETTIQILGKLFQIKCPPSQMASVQNASDYLNDKMRYFRLQGMTEFDKVAVISALNIVDQLLTHESQKENQLQTINQRLQALIDKVDEAID